MEDFLNLIKTTNSVIELKNIIIKLNEDLGSNAIKGFLFEKDVEKLRNKILEKIEDVQPFILLNSLGNKEIEKNMKDMLNMPTQTQQINANLVLSPQHHHINAKDINLSLTKNELIDIALKLKVSTSGNKDDIIKSIKKELKKQEKHVANLSASRAKCEINKISPLTTDPVDDWNSFSFRKSVSKTPKQCLDIFGHSRKIGKGADGEAYIIEYKGTPSIFKVIDLKETPFEVFKWECIIAERAAKIGVGPQIVEKSVCSNNEIPQYGILGMGQCIPISSTQNFTNQDLEEIYQLIKKLHSNKILHLDLGDRNLFKNSQGKFILIDFGRSIAYKLQQDLPRELVLWDFAYMFMDLSVRKDDISYFNFLKNKFPSNEFEYMKNIVMGDFNTWVLPNANKISKAIAMNFPIDMLRTLNSDIVIYKYIPFANDKEAQEYDRILYSRSSH